MNWRAPVLALALAPGAVLAQDTTGALDRGVRVGITYTSGVRPAIVVLPTQGLDSARAILVRDLDYSDRFEVINLPPGDSLPGRHLSPGTSKPGQDPRINYALFRTLGANYAVELTPTENGALVRLYDLAGSAVRKEQGIVLPTVDAPDFRMAVHRLSDDVVRWATGMAGIAASRIVYVSDRRLVRLDADGFAATTLTGEDEEVIAGVWAPDGRRIAYTRFSSGLGAIIVLDFGDGSKKVVPSTAQKLNFTPAFTPDGRTVAFARADEQGTDVYTASIAAWCCVQRLTVGRFADNLSPSYAPDGRRIAFVSTRAGLPQIYVMAADGTDQELLAPFDYGVTGSSYSPDWSPDGATVAFHRDVAGSPQIFIMDMASRRVRQLTSTGRNEDASWAPDGRHLVFVSDRSGRPKLWIIDAETGRIRQLTSSGAARLPSWSRRLAAPLPPAYPNSTR